MSSKTVFEIKLQEDGGFEIQESFDDFRGEVNLGCIKVLTEWVKLQSRVIQETIQLDEVERAEENGELEIETEELSYVG